MDYPFSLDNGLLKTREEARRIVTHRLPGYLWSLEARRGAAEQVTALDSGHAGYTISALVRAAWDVIEEVPGCAPIPRKRRPLPDWLQEALETKEAVQ